MKGEQGIYEIRNEVTGEVCIGSSKNTKGRMQGHKILLRKNEHHNKPLQRAWNKYGEKAFSFKHIETVYYKTYLFIRERDWINELEEAGVSLYNIGIPVRDDRKPKKSILWDPFQDRSEEELLKEQIPYRRPKDVPTSPQKPLVYEKPIYHREQKPVQIVQRKSRPLDMTRIWKRTMKRLKRDGKKQEIRKHVEGVMRLGYDLINGVWL